MDRRLLERIIIIILLLLNFFLLGVVISDRQEARRSTAETVASVTAVLRENGITVGEDARLLQAAPQGCTVNRSGPLEAEKIGGVLGAVSAEDLGGNILFYRSDRGQAVFHGSGELDILFSGDKVPVRGSREKTALRVLRLMGLTAQAAENTAENTDRMAFCCCWNGYPVYNAVLGFDFIGDSLQMVSGTRVFDSQTAVGGTAAMDSVSVLLRLVEIVKNEGFICSRLERLSPGYLMSVTASGESALTPVWRVVTDTGTLLINAETGRTETASP